MLANEAKCSGQSSELLDPMIPGGRLGVHLGFHYVIHKQLNLISFPLNHTRKSISNVGKSHPTRRILQVINRDVGEFTSSIEAPELEDMFGISEDAKALGCTLPDWIGSLIHIGALVVICPAAMREMTAGREFEILCKASSAASTQTADTP